jgi:CDP-diacylglycerol--serine O-phosphatidyltransferase
VANLVTYLSMAAAAAGIAAAGGGGPAPALFICLAVAGVADLLDGSFARRFKRSATARAEGIALDSLADAVAFVALPVAITARLGLPEFTWVVAAVYVVSGLTRLAWFDVQAYARMVPPSPAEPNKPHPETNRAPASTHYRGLPVAYVALILPVWWSVWIAFSPSVANWGCLVALAILSVLYLADMPVRKPRGAWSLALLVLAVAVVAYLVTRLVLGEP